MATLWERRFWDLYASCYDRLATHFPPYRRLLTEVADRMAAANSGRCLRLLDAGCGTGNHAWEFASRGHIVVGVDFSPAMLARAKSKSATKIGEADFLCRDLAQPFPFAEGEFDAAISVHVAYALPDPQGFLCELRRVVAVGGWVVVVTQQRPVEPFGALMDAFRTEGFRTGLRTFRALLGVGLLNVLINLRHRGGGYRMLDEQGLAAALTSAGFEVATTASVYTRGVSALVLARVPDGD